MRGVNCLCAELKSPDREEFQQVYRKFLKDAAWRSTKRAARYATLEASGVLQTFRRPPPLPRKLKDSTSRDRLAVRGAARARQ